jgi:hypothetical protein
MKLFYIQPRQVGKTTFATYEFLKNYEESLFILHSMDMVNHIKNNVKNFDNIISQNQFTNKIRNKKYKNIIIDEYLFFSEKNKKEIYEGVEKMDLENVIIYSTANKVYNSLLVDYISLEKNNYSVENLIEKFKKEYNMYYKLLNESFDIEKEFNDLYYNFLTDDNYNIITDDISLNASNKIKTRELRNFISKKEYELEVMNKFLI